MLGETKKYAVAKVGQLRPASRALVDDVGHSRVGGDVPGRDPFACGEGWCIGITTVDAPEPLKMRLLTRARGPFTLHCYLADGCASSRTIGHPVDPHAYHLILRPLVTSLRFLPVRRLCLLLEVADLESAIRKVPGIPGGLRVLLRHCHGEMTHQRVPAVVTGFPFLDLLRRG